MFIELNTQDSTPQELRALAKLFNELAGECVPEAQPVNAEATVATKVEQGEQPEAGTVTRRRRTKAEIEAEKAAAEAEAKAQENAISGESSAVDTNAPQVVTETVAVDATQKAGEDDWEKAVVAGAENAKTYTEAEVQQLAATLARTKGPTIVKDKITELGAGRIADLSANKLNELGAFLETSK